MPFGIIEKLMYPGCHCGCRWTRGDVTRLYLLADEVLKDCTKSSGVSVADECLEAYQEIKLGKKYRYIIFKLSKDLKKVIVSKKAELSETYDDFVDCVKADGLDCCYAVYDFNYTHNEMARKKLVFVLWAPDNAAVRQKMVYTSSKCAFRQKLIGIGVDLQANDFPGLAIEEVISKCCERSQ